ncbi:MAG: hypothetical protein LBT01_09655 [Spirochaetaceae bacterium]|jgi:hypothetical protein|nr:hypothetical protein [Spirochaetaceae bacterium]
MRFEKAIEEVVSCSPKGIRRPSWEDKTLRITGDKQFAGARVVPHGKESETIIEMHNDLQKKQENIYDGSDLFYRTDKIDYSDGGVYNGKPLKIGFAGAGLPYGKKDYMAKDWEVYEPDETKKRQ